MIQVIKDTIKIAEDIHAQSRHVDIDYKRLRTVAERMTREPLDEKQVDAHKIRKTPDLKSNKARWIILNELVSDSVNYCYWLYNSSTRPNGAGSTMMRSLLGS